LCFVLLDTGWAKEIQHQVFRLPEEPNEVHAGTLDQ
jgi:hypothetical protein